MADGAEALGSFPAPLALTMSVHPASFPTAYTDGFLLVLEHSSPSR